MTMVKAMRDLPLPLTAAAILAVGLTSVAEAQPVPVRVPRPGLTAVAPSSGQQTEYTEVVACPATVKHRAESVDGWQAAAGEAELSHAYTAEQGTRQVLYCYYKGELLLTRIVEPDRCQPLSAAAFKKSFLCKK